MCDPSKKYFFEFKDGEKLEISSNFASLSPIITRMQDDLNDESDEFIIPTQHTPYGIETYKQMYEIYTKITSIDKDFFTTTASSKEYELPENRTLKDLELKFKFQDVENDLLNKTLHLSIFLEMKGFENYLGKLIAYKIAEILSSNVDTSQQKEHILKIIPNADDPVSDEEMTFVEKLRTLFYNIL
jgi:hypothetical protein